MIKRLLLLMLLVVTSGLTIIAQGDYIRQYP